MSAVMYVHKSQNRYCSTKEHSQKIQRRGIPKKSGFNLKLCETFSRVASVQYGNPRGPIIYKNWDPLEIDFITSSQLGSICTLGGPNMIKKR